MANGNKTCNAPCRWEHENVGGRWIHVLDCGSLHRENQTELEEKKNKSDPDGTGSFLLETSCSG